MVGLMLGWAWSSGIQGERKELELEGTELAWKGLTTQVGREDAHRQLDVKSVMLCFVRTHEFQGREMFPALAAALTYLVLFYLL